MLLKGDVTIHAPRKKVGEFFIDSNRVGPYAPDVEKIETGDPDKRFRGTIYVDMGSAKAKFNGEVEFLKLDEPNHEKLKAHVIATGSAAYITTTSCKYRRSFLSVFANKNECQSTNIYAAPSSRMTLSIGAGDA